jgi:hypothetical protein
VPEVLAAHDPKAVKSETTKPSSTIFECKPCKFSITETIEDDPSKKTLQ